MAYTVTTNDLQTISITDELLNTSTSQTLIGRNATNYGLSIAANTVRQLESFAGNNAPTPAIKPKGQLWYNTSENTLRIYNGSDWVRTSLVPTASSDISSELVEGTQYFNTTEDKLKVYDGAVFRDAVLPGGTVTSSLTGGQSGSATAYGAKVETLFLTAQGASPSVIPVLALKYVSNGSTPGELADSAHDSAGATVMAIFSDNDFTVDASDPYYTTLSANTSFNARITKGMNLRADYKDSSISKANSAVFADTSSNILVGGGNISAANIIHTGSTNWVPSGVASVLGTSSNRFADLHVAQMQIGVGGSPNSIGILGDVSIGNVSNEVKEIFVHDLHVSGNLDFANVNALTNLESADIDDVTLITGTISTTASASDDIVNYSTLQAATTSASLVAGSTIVADPVSPGVTHSIFMGKGTNGNISTVTHSGITYLPSTSTLTTGTVSATTITDGSFSVTAGAITGASTGSFSGNINATYFNGTATSARYADLAEKYTADADYEAGTVVKIGGDAEITLTTEHADTEVFGVISTDPAYLMNNDIDGLPVALQGRVPVKVIGRIAKGQRLTTSDVPGVAWAADEDTPLQAIIGRSLENKDDGDQGVVEAVIGVK